MFSKWTNGEARILRGLPTVLLLLLEAARAARARRREASRSRHVMKKIENAVFE